MRITLVFKNVLFLLLAAVSVQATALTLPGDVDGNGSTNIADVSMLINYLLTGDSTLVSEENADVDADGNVTILDVSTLIGLLLTADETPMIETFTVEGVSFAMVSVEGGTFTMGSNNDPNTQPEHQVTLSDFCIGQTEVTQGLWTAVMGNNPSWFCSTEGYHDDMQRPVEEVNWYDCQDFIAKLNKLTGRHFRLPTEAEWEFAAMGGNKSQGYIYSGSNNLDEVAWWLYNIPSLVEHTDGYGTQPVGLKKPNELGLYDMSGNVLEWCQDWYAPYTSDTQVNPVGPATGDYKIIRSSSWASNNNNLCSVKFRSGYVAPWGIGINLGLRLVCTD